MLLRHKQQVMGVVLWQVRGTVVMCWQQWILWS